MARRRVNRAVSVAGPVAVVATASAVAIGVLGGEQSLSVAVDGSQGGAPDTTTSAGPATAPSASPSADVVAGPALPLGPRVDPGVGGSSRRLVVSRSEARKESPRPTERVVVRASPAEKLLARPASLKAIRQASLRLWTTAPLNLWDSPEQSASQDGLVEVGKRVLVTGRELDDREEIVYGGASRWVTKGYLVVDKPAPAPAPAPAAAPAAAAGLSMAPCPDPGVESGLTSGAVYLYRSVCNAFPQITTYGGYDAHGEHSTGKALDIMTSDPATLEAIGEFLRGHAAELNLYDIIREQQIWTPVRASEGWRYMSDRGSATANHYDHVHASVN